MAGRHLFVCVNHRASGKPACGPRGGDALVTAVQQALLTRGALEPMVTPCGCLGPCFDGPNAVLYPDGTWYAGLDLTDADGLADHLVDGHPLTAKISERPGSSHDDDALGGGAETEPARAGGNPGQRT